MYHIWIVEKFRRHAMKLVQSVLDLIDGILLEGKYWGMENNPMGFVIVTDQDRMFTHYLEAGPLMSDFTPPLSWTHVCGLMRILGALVKK